MEPRRLAHYDILQRIGRGGMGVVYRARDTRLGREVAIKLLRPEISDDRARRARFLREARAAASLHHPNIATIFEIGEVDRSELPDRDLRNVAVGGEDGGSALYIAMELVEGRDLKSILRDGPLRMEEALDIALQIGRALEVAHRAGVVHRDLKPGNVRITASGDAKLLDFGLAKVLPSDQKKDGRLDTGHTHLTFDGTIMGTPPYIAPEQLQTPDVDPRSDLYALGVLLFEMLTGTTPYLGSSVVAYVRALADGSPQRLRDFVDDPPEELVDLLAGLLHEDPGARIAEAREATDVLRALTGASESSLVLVPTAPLPPTRRASISRGPWPLVMLLALALAVAAIGWLQPWRVQSYQSLAVLPFSNRTGDASQDPRYEGLGFSLGRLLGEVPGLNVVDWTETRGYLRGDKDDRTIADELAVDWVLRGTVNRSARGTVSMSVVLTARAGLSAREDFTGAGEDLLERSQTIALWLIDQPSIALPRAARRRLTDRPAVPPGAFNTYLLGLEAYEAKRGSAYLETAERLFRAALSEEPDFALAHAALSEVLRRRWVAERSPSILAEADDAAQAAVRLDDDSPAALVALANVARAKGDHAAAIDLLVQVLAVHKNLDYAYRDLGRTYQDQGDPERARASYDQAIALRDGYWLNWAQRGAFLRRLGSFDEARRDYEAAASRAEPGNIWPLSNLLELEFQAGDLEAAAVVDARIPRPIEDADLANNIGTLNYFLGAPEKALEHYRLAVRLAPNRDAFYANLGDALAALDRPAEARDAYAQALALVERAREGGGRRRAATEQLRLIYRAKAGRCERLEADVTEVNAELAESVALVRTIAEAYSLCGDVDGALRALRRALDLGLSPAEIERLDNLAPLRDEPRFRALVTQAAP